MDGAGDRTEKNGNEKKMDKAEEEENRMKEDEEKSEEDSSDNPKPVVVVTKKVTDYKMGKLKSALEKQQQSSSDVILDATPLNWYSPALKKLKILVDENYLEAPTNDDTPDPNLHRPKLKIVRPKRPEPKPELLEPPRITYLRPRHDPKPACDPNSEHTPMGPTQERRVLKTAYETVKDALTFLKIEFGISSEDYSEMLETEGEEEYSLTRVTPDALFSMEEVVMELELFLNSMPETTTSDVMDVMLLEFQTRLGLPPHPRFYNLMLTSPAHFINYLDMVHQADDADTEELDANDDNNGGTGEEADNTMDGNNDGVTGSTTSGDKPIVIFCRGETSRAANQAMNVRSRNLVAGTVHGTYDHLPPPSLPFYDAIEILHQFVNAMENDEDFELDIETEFLNLQCDLQLPKWFSLFKLYKRQDMDGVIHFIHGYFQTSQISRYTDN